MSVYYCQEHKRDFKPDECISCEISKDLLDKEDEIKRLREENNRLQRISHEIAQELNRYKPQSKLAK